ncbi:N,N-dimethylformamidase beta subunit family domain-containing protein [Streptomyces sp. NPDC001812]|uniref:N,N-dimethylformamidase beta subunit family domain-containing protein n=1 Tax=Streptomyces sp. NPDC001812 TaxID=3364611 RepID=UPI00369507A0
MDGNTEHLEDEADSPGTVLSRRRFLGAVAGAGACAAGTALSGCDAPAGGDPGASTGPSERSRHGDPDWRLRATGRPEDVVGYTDKSSVLPGEGFGLYVSTTSPVFRVSAYRVGWYGGAQARLVWRSETMDGRVQAASHLLSATRTVRAGWERTAEVRTEGWPEGAYLLRLDASSGHQRYVPLIVRSATARGRTLLIHAPATWQAYNLWGGYSLYEGDDGSYGMRALAVSFARPYDSDGAEKFLVHERAVVVLAERLGIPLAYTTGVDIHRDPAVLRGVVSAVTLGHDEYWTPQQRQSMTRARDAGTNLAFLGANTCFRRIRLEEGDRTVVCYKTDHRHDPLYPRHGALVTTDFRQAPEPDPESSLTGVLYEGYPVNASYVVHNADHWLFAGTGVKRGDSFTHLVGVEYDRVTPGSLPDAPIEIVAHSPLVCNGRRSHSDSAYYTMPSGAGVFASGTMRWVEGLMAGTVENGRNHGMDARTGAFVTRTTENLLRAFAEGPAAGTRPAPRDNVREVYGSA